MCRTLTHANPAGTFHVSRRRSGLRTSRTLPDPSPAKSDVSGHVSRRLGEVIGEVIGEVD